jgi:hypothetical protein
VSVLFSGTPSLQAAVDKDGNCVALPAAMQLEMWNSFCVSDWLQVSGTYLPSDANGWFEIFAIIRLERGKGTEGPEQGVLSRILQSREHSLERQR